MKNTVGHTGIYAWGDCVRHRFFQKLRSNRRTKNPLPLGMRSVNDHDFEPVREHPYDAGIDLKTPISIDLKAHNSVKVDLQFRVAIPEGYEGKLESKSGLNINFDTLCPGGVVDSHYTGSVVAKMYNFGDSDYHFNAGDKIVQLVIRPVPLPVPNRCKELPNENTDRGNGGFGSTGR